MSSHEVVDPSHTCRERTLSANLVMNWFSSIKTYNRCVQSRLSQLLSLGSGDQHRIRPNRDSQTECCSTPNNIVNACESQRFTTGKANFLDARVPQVLDDLKSLVVTQFVDKLVTGIV